MEEKPIVDQPQVQPELSAEDIRQAASEHFRSDAYKQQRTEELMGGDKNQSVADNSLTPPETPPTDAQPPADFSKFLVEATNGRIDSPDKLNSILSEYEQNRQKIAELSQNTSVSPYANEFAEKFNKLVSGAASHQQLLDFVRYNSPEFNPDQMNDKDVLIEYYRASEGIPPSDVEEYLEENYGDADLGEVSGSKLINLKQEVRRAREFLSTQKVKVSENPAERQHLAQQQQLQQLHNQWDGIVGNMVQSLSELPVPMSEKLLNLSAEGPEGDAKVMTFNYQIPDNFKPILQQTIHQQAVAQNLQPTRENLQYLYGLADQIVWSKYGKQIAQQMVLDVYAKTSEDYAKYYAGQKVNRQVPQSESTAKSQRQKGVENYKQKRAQELLKGRR